MGQVFIISHFIAGGAAWSTVCMCKQRSIPTYEMYSIDRIDTISMSAGAGAGEPIFVYEFI